MRESRVDWLGMIPEDWEVRRLRDSVKGCFNGVWGDEPNGHEDIVCVRVADFVRPRLRVKIDEPTLRAVRPADRRRRLLRAGDLLLEKSGGGDLQPVGAVMLFDHDIPAVCSNFVGRMPVATGYDSGFLAYLHSHLYAIGLNRRSIKQSTGIQNLDSSAYLSEHVAYPQLEEQRAIVRFLDHAHLRIRRAIYAKQKLIALLNELKQAVIHRAVTRGFDPNVRLKPSGVEWLGDVPEHWEVVPSRAMFRHRNERAGEDEEVLTASQAHGIVSRSDFMARQGRRVMQVITGRDILKQVEPNDFVMSMRSFEGGLEWSQLRGAVSSAYVILVPTKNVYPPYFARLLKTRSYISALRRTSDLVRDGQALRYANFLQVPLLRVPHHEQRAIAAFLKSMVADLDDTIQRVQREVDLLREYRTRLIADVVTGKLDVRDAAASLPDEVDEPEPLETPDVEEPAEVEVEDSQPVEA